MQCPVCSERMREIEKYGVTVDICPGCKGVWLDRGELEKLAKREDDDDLEPRSDRGDQYRSDDDDHHREGGRRPKRRSLFSDLLEGFGE